MIQGREASGYRTGRYQDTGKGESILRGREVSGYRAGESMIQGKEVSGYRAGG